ncbi:MAG: hypothetical protein QM569_06585 [Acidovorax sp.]|uniref:hypothetical protein n=1 Tax=Acidovorax sp. TaxID=1872122 RepID=UPI0039E26CB5
MDSLRSPLSLQLPVAQFLAQAALQRQSNLLATAEQASPPAAVPEAQAQPLAADKASISPQAREQLGAGPDPRGAASAAAAPMAAPAAAAWPSKGVPAPLLHMVSALVQQVTAGAAPQRVVAAQPWPLALAQALEGGTADENTPPLQTWLVRQGTAQTPEGPRGFALTLRVPVPWLAAQAPAAPSAPQAQAALRLPFSGAAQSLQSGVLALVLQGADGTRTSALLVLDFQPHLAAAVYGREMLQQARMDPWTQMAVLQASGQVPRDEEKDRARNGASGLCETLGCPYERRAACAQPFCAALRWVEPLGPTAPLA